MQSIGLRQGTAFYLEVRRAAVPQAAQNLAALAAEEMSCDSASVVHFKFPTSNLEIASRIFLVVVTHTTCLPATSKPSPEKFSAVGAAHT